jgi:hypothetical protein
LGAVRRRKSQNVGLQIVKDDKLPDKMESTSLTILHLCSEEDVEFTIRERVPADQTPTLPKQPIAPTKEHERFGRAIRLFERPPLPDLAYTCEG